MNNSHIFHVDMDAFFVSVEELLDPSLKGKPVVVGAQPGHRGVVAAASYEARKYGIYSAMPVSEAVRRCPHAIFLPGHPGLYSKYSNEIYEILCRYSPIVEMVSIDEGYLDMTGSERMFATPSTTASVQVSIKEGGSNPNRQPSGAQPSGSLDIQETSSERRQALSMVLDPRNLLGVSIASPSADDSSSGIHSSYEKTLESISEREFDIPESAKSSARKTTAPRSRIPTLRPPVIGNRDSIFFMMSVAHRLREEIHEHTGLSASIGIGTSRLVAKVASDLAKPRGIFMVAPAHEPALLAPLNIRRIPGIGPKTERQLNDLGIHTVGDLQKYDAAFLREHFGRWGESLALKAQGGSDWRYWGDEDPKSISHENTFATDTKDREQIESTLVYLTQRVGKRLRDHRLFASTIQLKLRDSKFNTMTRAVSLCNPTDIDAIFLKNALALLHNNWDGKTLIRLIGIGVSGLGEQGPQRKLVDVDPSEKLEKLYQAADSIRDKYGFDVLKSPRGEKKRFR